MLTTSNQFSARIVAKIQNELASKFANDAAVPMSALVDLAQAYGYLQGGRGRSAQEPTDQGLLFIGEDPATVHAAEEAEAEKAKADALALSKSIRAEVRARIKQMQRAAEGQENATTEAVDLTEATEAA